MRMHPYRWLKRATVAAAALAASILAPTILIWLDALMKRDVHAIYTFAVRTAEPVALVAAAAVTFLGARRFAEPGGRAADEGAAIGAISAAALFAAALWVNDVDGWTIAAAALLPLAGFAGGTTSQHAGRRRMLDSHPPSSLPPSPLPHSAHSPRCGTKSPRPHY